jgi:hypothetical protein
LNQRRCHLTDESERRRGCGLPSGLSLRPWQHSQSLLTTLEGYVTLTRGTLCSFMSKQGGRPWCFLLGRRKSESGRKEETYIFCFGPAPNQSISDSSPAKFYTLSLNHQLFTVFAMASLLACFKCRLEIRVKQQKVDCSSCKNRFYRVLCSGISTKAWKENSVLLKTAFVCSDSTSVSYLFKNNASFKENWRKIYLRRQ